MFIMVSLTLVKQRINEILKLFKYFGEAKRLYKISALQTKEANKIN